MKRTVLLTVAAMLATLSPLAAGAAPARPQSQPPQASIPFANMRGSINDWRAVGDDGLYVQDMHNRWYFAKLMGPCIDLPFAQRIGFDVRGTNTLDRFSSIIVRGQRCPLTSLTASAPPPKKAKAKAHQTVADRRG